MNSAILLSVLVAYGIPKEDASMLVCIAEHESNFDTEAYNDKLNSNGTVDVGVFQINSVNFEICNVEKDELFDAKVNAQCAIKIYKTQGLKAWSTYKFCHKEEFFHDD